MMLWTLAEENLPMTQDAMFEVYQEYKAQPWNPEVRKKLAIYSFKHAVMYHRDKKYHKSAIGCYWALSFDPCHFKALQLLDYLKSKHLKELGNVIELYE